MHSDSFFEVRKKPFKPTCGCRNIGIWQVLIGEQYDGQFNEGESVQAASAPCSISTQCQFSVLRLCNHGLEVIIDLLIAATINTIQAIEILL